MRKCRQHGTDKVYVVAAYDCLLRMEGIGTRTTPENAQQNKTWAALELFGQFDKCTDRAPVLAGMLQALVVLRWGDGIEPNRRRPIQADPRTRLCQQGSISLQYLAKAFRHFGLVMHLQHGRMHPRPA